MVARMVAVRGGPAEGGDRQRSGHTGWGGLVSGTMCLPWSPVYTAGPRYPALHGSVPCHMKASLTRPSWGRPGRVVQGAHSKPRATKGMRAPRVTVLTLGCLSRRAEASRVESLGEMAATSAEATEIRQPRGCFLSSRHSRYAYCHLPRSCVRPIRLIRQQHSVFRRPLNKLIIQVAGRSHTASHHNFTAGMSAVALLCRCFAPATWHCWLLQYVKGCSFTVGGIQTGGDTLANGREGSARRWQAGRQAGQCKRKKRKLGRALGNSAVGTGGWVVFLWPPLAQQSRQDWEARKGGRRQRPEGHATREGNKMGARPANKQTGWRVDG